MLGDELKRLREDRGLAMAKLAQLSGLSRQHLYAIESGQSSQPNTSTLIKLARGLASWRGGEPDQMECGEVFRTLERAAGYPVSAADSSQLASGETESTPIPEPLARSLLQIVENWPRWGQTEREHAAQLLDVVSHFGRGEDTMTSDDSRTPEMKHSKYLALYLDCLAVDPLRTAHAPIRKLAFAGA